MAIEALLDSNIIVAALVEEHPHHRPSLNLLFDGDPSRFAIAAHSHAEAFNTLTKPRGPYRRQPTPVADALTNIASRTHLIGLTPEQTLAAIRRYAEAGGVGARLYDALIGETALAAGLRRVVTWNTTHLRELFPRLEVLTPEGVAGVAK